MAEARGAKAGISIVVNLLTLALLLLSPFMASGDWGWGLGWAYTGSMILFTIVSRAIAIRLHPGFARERATSAAMDDTKGWDKWLVPALALWLPLAATTIAGLDERLGWSAGVPGWARWLGAGRYVVGFAFPP